MYEKTTRGTKAKQKTKKNCAFNIEKTLSSLLFKKTSPSLIFYVKKKGWKRTVFF